MRGVWRSVSSSIPSRCENLLTSHLEDVIGLTTTACAMNWPLIERLDVETVICEEAGEVMEAQTLCTLFPTIEHAIFIGDPQQLRSVTTIRSVSS